MTEQLSLPQKHYFRLKGMEAEEVLAQLANRTFLTDWCFPNPVLPSGKELCDLLVVFDETVIIWQAKSLKAKTTGKLREGELQKNFRQLGGAKRQLFDLKTPITLQNARRRAEQFDPSNIREVFLISVLLGDTPELLSMSQRVKGHQCHVFTREFTEIVLNELDTIADFCAYLREKERTRDRVGSFILEGGEEQILGWYLLNDRTLSRLDGCTSVFLTDGIWDEMSHRPEYQAKKKADEISYIWDELIDRAHTSDSPEYERVARELARRNRFERRYLAQAYFDAHMKAHENATPEVNFRRVFVDEYGVFCFVFAHSDVSREKRRDLLETVCFVARGKTPQHKMVVGIATEMQVRRESSLDYLLLEIPEWGPEQEVASKRLQDEFGILRKPTRSEFSTDEYPETSTRSG